MSHGSKLFFFGKIHLSMNGWRTNLISNGGKSRSSIKQEWHKAIRIAVACIAFNRQYSPTVQPAVLINRRPRDKLAASRWETTMWTDLLVDVHGLHQPSSLLTYASSSPGDRAPRAAMTSTASTPHGVAAPPRSALMARSSCASPLACCQSKLQLWRPAGSASTPVGTSSGDTSHWRG